MINGDVLHFESGSSVGADVELAAILRIGINSLRLSTAWSIRWKEVLQRERRGGGRGDWNYMSNLLSRREGVGP